MKEKTCCFTGHRNLNNEVKEKLPKILQNKIEKLIKQGVIYFGCGGARGFDTLAAKTIIKLKNSYPQIKLILVLPCKNQCQGWGEDDLNSFAEICLRQIKWFMLPKPIIKAVCKSVIGIWLIIAAIALAI